MRIQTNSIRRRRRQSIRHASAVIEVLVSVTLLSLVVGLAAQMNSASVRQRRMTEVNRVARDTADCLMTWAMAQPFEELTEAGLNATATELGIAPESWTLAVEREPSAIDRMAAKRITISLKRLEGRDPRRGVSLVAWRYAIEGPNEQRPPAEAEAASDNRGDQ